MRFCSSWSGRAWRDIRPTPTLRFLATGFFGQLEHALAGRAVHRDRLFHEDIQVLLDRIREMNPAESRWSGEDGHVARLQAIHRFLVSIETDELAFFGDIDLCTLGCLLSSSSCP